MVSVHTQSMTARSSVRKGTRRKLQTQRDRQSVKGLLARLGCVDLLDSPLEQEQVQVVVALGQEVSQNPCWVTGADLIG